MTNDFVGQPIARVEGRAKVTGEARYAADFDQPGQAYAVMVGASVGLGTIKRIHSQPVLEMPGVLAVITPSNAPRLPYLPHKGPIDPAIGERLHVLQDNVVRFYGQPVAILVANSIDTAERAANALRIDYESAQPRIDLSAADIVVPEAGRRAGARTPADSARGDADAALAQAAVFTDQTYRLARENHNPMEPHATVAAWQGDRLTLWSKSQFVGNEAAEIAAVFGLPAERVLVICPYVGGAFGTSLRTWAHVTLAAVAARMVKRPVKLVLTRRQMFHNTGHRPRTHQRVAIGAEPDGKLVALIHEGLGETSRHEQFIEALTTVSTYMYACANVRTSYRLGMLDTATSTYMRGPGESSGIYALECAMDELAVALKTDPVALRMRNEPTIDEHNKRPFSSRSLRQCFAEGAERFGWAERNPEARSMREGRLLVGWGTAAATYPAAFNAASARVRFLPDGSAEVETAASDMGPGTYTSMTQVAASALKLPLQLVRFALGRSDFPSTPPHGGSQTMASVGSAVLAAAQAALRELVARAVADPASPLSGLATEKVEAKDGRLYSPSGAMDSYVSVLQRSGKEVLGEASEKRSPEVAARYSMHAFGALFVEVTVDPDLSLVRVRRALGVYAAGRIVNPRLAASQCVGGMIGGIGMALMEQTLLDSRDGRPINASLADYLVPVNLDVGKIEAHFVEEVDPHVNVLGVKGLGEIALIGMAPAIANAVFHATGKRLRSLPIRLENLID